jgi:radical SAM protein with 4Fe4S-binding SPASM domain
VPGAFAGSLLGIEAFKRAGVEFQINTTITRINHHQIKDILRLAQSLGAAAHHIFLLVPTGRGRDLADQEISREEYEETLHWFYEESLTCPLQLKATCAPHYYRIVHQRKKERKGRDDGSRDRLNAMTRGCMGGSSFCFISHTGQVQPCGFLEIDCGQLKEKKLRDIWEHSKVFNDLRDLTLYKGKCGRCEFLKVCGGCRARAYEMTGDYLAEEPFCVYEPKKRR